MNEVMKLQKIIDESNNIVFFGGAGVSTESGLKDFRGKNGLYKQNSKYPPEYLLSYMCLVSDPELFFDYYKNNLNYKNVKPNITHKYLSKLESAGKLKAIVTQNIDGLHEAAGSKNVLAIHGTIKEAYCMKCGKSYPGEFIFNSKGIAKCECGGTIRPNVVLYGESLNESYNKAINYISKCDTLIVAGTSLRVEPAASLVRYFNGKNLVIINEEETPYDYVATLLIHKPLGEVFGKLKI